MARLGGQVLMALLLIAAVAGAATAAPAGDVRLLVDVSGSMKKNDPANLRAPGLRLFIDLLPPQATAGIWLFSGDTELLAAPGPTTDAWQRAALAGSDRIHSRGQYTDIGGALDTALADWNAGATGHRRSLILLTDGMVDVSPKPGANAAARERILAEILPRLREREITVHAIALSANADRALLRQLAIGTGGTLTVAESAATLQQIFLGLFERTVDRQTVPLTDGGFSIDPSVHELTLIAFAQGDSAPRLQPPNAGAFGQDSAPAGVRWVSEPGYDLITVDRPAPGQWRLLGPEDPANRVMIVTDLELRVGRLPSRVLPGETLSLDVRLVENGETIVRREFLDLVNIRATVESSATTPASTWLLRDDGKDGDRQTGDGIFTLELAPSSDGAGTLTVLTRVDGRTFEREDRQQVQVTAGAIAIEQLPGDEAGHVELLIRPQLEWLHTSSMRLVAQVPGPDGVARPVPVETTGTPPWRLSLDGLPPGRTVPVDWRLEALTVSGRGVGASPPTAVVTVPGQPASEKPTTTATATTAAATDTSWALVAVVVVAANALLFAIAGIGWLVLRRRNAAPVSDDEDDDDAEPVGQG